VQKQGLISPTHWHKAQMRWSSLFDTNCFISKMTPNFSSNTTSIVEVTTNVYRLCTMPYAKRSSVVLGNVAKAALKMMEKFYEQFVCTKVFCSAFF